VLAGLDERTRQLSLRLVYFGPPGSGKAANLQRIHELLPAEGRSRIRAFSAGQQPAISGGLLTFERTVSFDMTLASAAETGWSLQLTIAALSSPLLQATKVATVTQADAVAFVADASRARRDENHEAIRECEELLRTSRRITPPLVLQVNKRDRDDAVHDDEIEREWGERKWPIFTASADRGDGVRETFTCLLRVAFEAADRADKVEERTGLTLRGVTDAALKALRQTTSPTRPADRPTGSGTT
jgi:mutual gliding-motility protein MglA